ncbi:hypothetical protein LJC49_10075 [Ruminococcaceae bacterium OttesenSCG-928-I18]|nr:hypothetical protein [Ruminococcaceae bacterium OttesenSCG-928-I18]
MKKTLSLALCALLLFGLAACGGTAQNTSPAAAPEASQPAAPPPASESAPVEETPSSSASVPEAAPAVDFESWNALFTEYNNRMMNDTSAFTSDADVGFAALTLLGGEIELSYTNSFFQPDAEASTTVVLEMFGLTDVTYTEQGDMATAEGVDSGGLPVKFELHYDGANTAVLLCYEGDVLQSELSLCVTGDYAAKMYKDYDGDDPETVCAIVKPNGDVWMGADTQVLEGSLYQNGEAAEDPAFTKGLPEHYSYVDGALAKS